VFGRKSSTAAEPAGTAESEAAAKAAGKGRPTPKRREAEQRNRQPLIGAPRLPANATKEERKAAREAQRQAASAERLKSREALLTGDERHLPAQHRGPARKWARDYVDARRNLGDYLFPIAIVVLGAGLLPVPAIRPYTLLAVPLLYLYLVLVLVDAYLLSRRINRRAYERFGAQSAGAGRYGALRSMQIRRFRLPRPQVARGQYPE
jgi:Protein of unknown function (DUF3043)